jgi:GWxTD domain-containing protein
MNTRLIGIVIFTLITINAFSQRNFHKINFAQMYDFNKTSLHPKYQCYHDKDSSSTIFYEIDLSELTYQTKIDSSHIAKATIHYEIFYNYKAKDLLDSGTVYLRDTENYGKDNSSIGFFEIPISYGSEYLVHLTINDTYGKQSSETLMDINKLDKFSQQNYYLRGVDRLPYLHNYINRGEEFQLISEQNNLSDKIKIKYFKPNNSIARPPMVGIKSNKRIIYADTNFDIQFSDGYSNLLKLKDQGFYFFNFSYKQEVGYTVFQFNSNYPYINTQMQMLMPLRYISSKKEFENLFHSKNKQKAIEDFWVEISGSKERAKNMIKLYYNRVQNANIYFTSDKEGWMTDRGMIYIIYGAPDVVYRNKSMETWKYGDHKSSSNSITFDFYKANNPFTDNDYNMSRSTAYGPSWNRAIEIWRR